MSFNTQKCYFICFIYRQKIYGNGYFICNVSIQECDNIKYRIAGYFSEVLIFANNPKRYI